MRRHEALASLSRDHHQALFQALQMKRASTADAESVRTAMLEFWSEHGAKHFRIEEEILLPAFAHRADPADEAVVRVLVDHVRIRAQVQALAAYASPQLDALHALGGDLEAHVRHEERTLFPLIERALPEPELVDLAEAVAAAEASES